MNKPCSIFFKELHNQIGNCIIASYKVVDKNFQKTMLEMDADLPNIRGPPFDGYLRIYSLGGYPPKIDISAN